MAKRWWFHGFLVFLCGGWLLVSSGCNKPEEKKAEPSVPVEVGRVVRSDLKEYLRFTGDIEGATQVQVYAQVAERIARMRVEVGQRVKKGQVLAIVKHLRLRQAQAQARAQLAGVRSQLSGVRVNIDGAQTSRQSALREYNRLKKLLKSGAIGQQQVDMSKAQLDGATTRLNAAKAQVQTLRAQIRALRAGVAQAGTVKRSAIIRAPISGIIARRYREEGDMAVPQTPLFHIVQMDRVKVSIRLTGPQLAKVRVGSKAEVQVAAYPGQTFIGRVSRIAPTLDADTRMAPAEISIPNIVPVKPPLSCRKTADCLSQRGVCKGGRCIMVHPLKPGMIGQVRLLVGVHTNSLLIPLSSILNNSFGYQAARQQRGLAVLVLDGQNQPKRRNIQIGLQGPNNTVQILSGLRVGERIITTGHNLYKRGAKIKIVREKTSSWNIANKKKRTDKT